MNQVLILALFSSLAMSEDLDSTNSQHKEHKIQLESSEYQTFSFRYHQPKFILDDPINIYSLIHFIEYGVLSLIPAFKINHFWFISISWELLELFLPNDWARESWANKMTDLLFNLAGFYFGRRMLKYLK